MNVSRISAEITAHFEDSMEARLLQVSVEGGLLLVKQ